jgi:hypothetical protein
MTASVPGARSIPTIAGEVRLEYRGFRNTQVGREYLVLARLLDDAREYVVAIEHAAFAARQVSFQDGPDICFQRMRRELLGKVLLPLPALTITDVELAAYRTAHAPPARRSGAVLPQPAGSDGSPVPHTPPRT